METEARKMSLCRALVKYSPHLEIAHTRKDSQIHVRMYSLWEGFIQIAPCLQMDPACYLRAQRVDLLCSPQEDEF